MYVAVCMWACGCVLLARMCVCVFVCVCACSGVVEHRPQPLLCHCSSLGIDLRWNRACDKVTYDTVN